ncbi:exonuclease SbcCD subunit D [Dysgonomonas sp. GY617]|uniref:metallophosphoesterase family protein n=1 Tax=Dysgonomonas sp. GY617 TaxID=2780420 RepID=UPI0018834209|nr:phosphoesterase [Dysgonomonas sp. GY617]MBF0575532.1 phosphoesterase [Dysgonomonas sp. GY617]
MFKTIFPCVLLINDIHVSKDNLSEFSANWNEALSVCKKLDMELIAVGGDLFQSRAAQTLDVLLAVHDALVDADRQGIQVILANGNHDKVNQESVRGYCHVFDSHDNVMLVDESMSICKSDWDYALHIIPYFPENGSFKDKLDAVIQDDLVTGRKNYLYIHEGINGALLHASANELPISVFSGFDKVFVGHYHNRCTIKGTEIEYTGSSRQHNFGEDEEKGYTVLYNDGSYEFIKNQVNTRYRVIDTDADKVDIHLSDLLEEIKADGRYKVKVRVHASTATAPGIDKNILLNAGATKVEVITDEPEIIETQSGSLFEKFDFHNIQVNYQEFCRQKDIDNVSLGLTYLSKIKN